jgi:hypothetical protein
MHDRIDNEKERMDIRVECYSGHRGEETPRYLLTKNRKIKVKKILDRWLAPDHRYFKIIGEDEALYIIRHDQKTWKWELTFYRITQQPFNGYSEMNGDHTC